MYVLDRLDRGETLSDDEGAILVKLVQQAEQAILVSSSNLRGVTVSRRNLGVSLAEGLEIGEFDGFEREARATLAETGADAG